MDLDDGFVPIMAVFYAVFHPLEGTKIVHQVPEDSIATGDATGLFSFGTVKNYIIPKPQLCDRLVLIKVNGLRIVGYPVNIESSIYSRNSFTFNFGFVFSYNADTTPYELAIRRMGRMFRALEEQLRILSKLDRSLVFFSQQVPELDTRHTPGQSHIRRFTLQLIELLIAQVYADLNNYSECCIPIDSANSIDIKLFPILPPPVCLEAHQVPIATVKLSLLIDVNWDPTMVKILPFINGVHSVQRISELADADYVLTQQCIQHLMHYRCIAVADLFQFGAIYAPTNRIGDFVQATGMAEECQAYILAAASESRDNTPSGTPNSGYLQKSSQRRMEPKSVESHALESRKSQTSSPRSPKMERRFGQVEVPSKATLFFLYRLLNQGQTIKEWYLQHEKALRCIDVRRFITFGVLRGIIYRVSLYPVEKKAESVKSMDAICTELGKLRRQVEAMLGEAGDVAVISC